MGKQPITLPLPCLICGKQLEDALPREEWLVKLKDERKSPTLDTEFIPLAAGSQSMAQELLARIILEVEGVEADDFLIERGEDMAPSNQPYKGTTFHSYGHYGSTVFDPFNQTYLEVNICDDCLLARTDKIVHVMVVSKPREHVISPWDPEKEVPESLPRADLLKIS